jgi:hypothetical protein
VRPFLPAPLPQHVRDPLAGTEHSHPHGAGVAGTQESRNDARHLGVTDSGKLRPQIDAAFGDRG